MPQYRVLELSYINGVMVEAGAIVDFDGIPAYNLELVDPREQVSVDKASRAQLVADLAKLGVTDLSPSMTLEELRGMHIDEVNRQYLRDMIVPQVLPELHPDPTKPKREVAAVNAAMAATERAVRGG